MTKKIIALFAAMLMALTLVPTGFAADSRTEDQRFSSASPAVSYVPSQSDATEDAQAPVQLPLEDLSGFRSKSDGKVETFESNPATLTKDGVTLFGYNCDPGANWTQFSSSNPSSLPRVGGYSTRSFYAAEYFQGTIYAICQGGGGTFEFGTLNKDTLVFTRISECEKAEDMAMDYSTGVMYAICAGKLKTIDCTTGTFTTVATVSGIAGGMPIVMAISTDGHMYCVGMGEDGFYEINKTTGVATLIGHTGISAQYSQSATFDHETQTLFWASLGTLSQLVTVDTQTGSATVLGVLGTQDASGSEICCLMTFNDNVPLPNPVPVSGVEMSEESAELIEGDTFKIDITVYPTNQYVLDKSVTWSSSNETVATVDDNGLVTALSGGNATITVTTTDGGFSDTCSILVRSMDYYNLPIREALNVGDAQLPFINNTEYPWASIEEGDRLCAISTNHESATTSSITLLLNGVVGGSTITWDWKVSSSIQDEFLFAVNGEYVTTLSGETDWKNFTYTFPTTGNYTLAWYYSKSVFGSSGSDSAWLDNVVYEALEPSPVSGVEVSPKEYYTLLSGSASFTANVLPINALNRAVTWSSSNPYVATINSNGDAFGLSLGDTIITATTVEGGYTDTAVLHVIEFPPCIPHTQMSYDNELVIDGETCNFTLDLGMATRIYKPSPTTGETTGVAAYGYGFTIEMQDGQGTQITTYAANPMLDTCIWVFDTDFNMYAFNDDAGPGVVTSSLTFVAPRAGSYFVLVTSYSLYYAGDVSIDAVSYNPVHVTGVEIDMDSLDISLARYGDFTATVLPENADQKECIWTVSDPNIASIDERTGRVFGLRVGTTTVTATTSDGDFSDTATLNVLERVNPQYDGRLYGYNLAFSNGLNGKEEGFFSIDGLDTAEDFDIIFPTNLRIYSGEYYDGLIYAYGLVTDYIAQYPYFYIIDPNDWSIQFVSTDITNVCFDMTYDYSTDTMYGISNDSEAVVNLCKINMNTGDLTMLAPIDFNQWEVPMTLACEFDGTLYTMSHVGTLYEITDKASGTTRSIGSIGHELIYVQSMTFDRVAKQLYLAQIDRENSRLVRIDKQTAAVIDETAFGPAKTQVTSLFSFGDIDDMNSEPLPTVAAQGVEIRPEEVSLDVDGTIKLRPVFIPNTATNRAVTWSSNNDSIATVDSMGNVTAIGPGACYISIVSEDGGFTDKALIRVNTPPVPDLEQGMARVTIVAPDIWGDGTGYQMLLDADHNTFGSTFPVPDSGSTSGSFVPTGDVPDELYDLFEYKMPENADGRLNTLNVLIGETMTIDIPAGVYDWCITNPAPRYNRVYFAVNGRADNFVMEAGKEYTFTLRFDITTDWCDWSSKYIGFEGDIEYFTATFIDFDGSLISQSTVNKGDDAVAPADPYREGFAFDGWDTDFTNMQGDITVKATYHSEVGIAGDVNLDGVINTGDVAMLLRSFVGLTTLTPEQIALSDFNNDSYVNTGDAASILAFCLE